MKTATCSCGQLSLTYDGEITRTSMCHCWQCQQRTGSVFGTQTRLPLDAVKFSGEATEYRRVGDAGGNITFRFCPTCGATLYWELDTIPGFVIVGTGSFADRDLPAPVFSVYEDRMHPWVVVPEGAERIG